MKTYIKLFRYVSVIKKEILSKIFLNLLICSTYLAQAAQMANVVRAVQGGEVVSTLITKIAVVPGLILVRSFFVKQNESLVKVFAAKIKEKLRFLMMEKLFELGPGFVNDQRSGNLSSLILDGVESLEAFFIFFYLFRLDHVSAAILLASMSLCVLAPLFTIFFGTGTVAAVGTHKELLETSEAYRKLLANQTNTR